MAFANWLYSAEFCPHYQCPLIRLDLVMHFESAHFLSSSLLVAVAAPGGGIKSFWRLGRMTTARDRGGMTEAREKQIDCVVLVLTLTLVACGGNVRERMWLHSFSWRFVDENNAGYSLPHAGANMVS